MQLTHKYRGGFTEVILEDDGLMTSSRVIHSKLYQYRQFLPSNKTVAEFKQLLDSMSRIDDELWVKMVEAADGR